MDRIERLERMRDKYLDQGLDVAAARAQAQIDDLEREPCDVCHSIPCQCDVEYEKGMDREMFPDD